MLRFVAALYVLVISAQVCGAEPQQSANPGQESQAQTDKAPNQPLLKKVFQSQYSKEQLAQFKEAPSLAQLVRSMSQEQRQGARMSLAGLEAEAKTPSELAQIARGYLMLDEQEPERGQNAIRVATQLEQLDPASPVGPTLVAEALFQMRDYPAATQAAQEALGRDPDDPNANAIYNLSVGRRGTSKELVTALAHASASQEEAQRPPQARHDPEQQEPSVQKKRDSIVVPSAAKTGSDTPAQKPVGLPPLPLLIAALGLGIAGLGIYRAGKSGEAEEPAPEPPPKGLLDIADDLVFRAKTFIQDHPYASLTVGVGAVIVMARLAGPAILAGGGGMAARTGLVLGRGGAVALAPASATSVTASAASVTLPQAGAVAGGGALLLMKGDAQDNASKAKDGAGGGGRGKTSTPRIDEKSASHIFRDETGHISDTPENRRLLIETASEKGNFAGRDRFGNEWFARLTKDGKQVWVEVRDGLIRNGGMNNTPLDMRRYIR